MGLTAAGIGSGLDINGIVSALVDASFVPRQVTLDQREAAVQTEVSAIGTLKSAMSEFQDKLESLQKLDTFDKRKATTNISDYLTASAESDATPGTYNVVVKSLAESHKIGSAAVADADSPVGEGQLTLTAGVDDEGNPTSMTLNVEADDTLADIAAKINSAEDNPGITATIITGDNGPRLVMTSDKTGTDHQITVTATDTNGTGLTDTFGAMEELVAAENASLTIDGMDVTSQSNSVKDAIQGVTLNLKDAELSKTTKVTIAKDTGSAKTVIKEFVDAYNGLQEQIDSLSAYDAETETAGPLQGDSLPRSITSQLRNVMSSAYDLGNGETGSLAQFGLSFDRYGKLNIDDDQLNDALKDDAASIAQLFAAEDTGLAYRLDSTVDVYTQTGGLLSSRDDTLKSQLDRIESDRDQLNRQMAAYEARLFKQFNAMDSVVYQLNAQAAMLTERLSSLPGLVRSS
ncbi:flagellar filament capping protein FliD [Ferrimonas balearica]|uniref:flagellar filament capping protein FliD n=1 Tax=Ferrimonas balearica TaxID=44012 RepID=UPI001C559A01|nr:flagellar filament capping protein FliD [Ferrimonas balearica]MBW3138144.1 flagellar filament capping protein FliD [Ferrimonas balearica]MBY5978901.1 flagellar filament capping protein FliD [Ferrimonas balearica]MBY6105209.1 flagellar filament capping protein FliD [Ferrimonas balearica]